MYGGHVGIALGAKGVRSTIPLWVLLIATQLPDWVDAIVCATGISSSSPPSGMLSHSLPAIAVLATVLSFLWYTSARDAVGAGLVALVVISHSVADYATGLKPTWPDGPLIGLQLYQRPVIDFAIEAIVIVVGWNLYRRSLAPERRTSGPTVLLLASLLLLQLAASASFALFPGVKKC